MLFWSKKNKDITIQCPICEWQPDGEGYWICTCGHSWNTFATKAKCPLCGIQWENTSCPACHKSTPHKEWYKTKEEIEAIENSGDRILRAKKKSLESRLIDYGIKNYRVGYLPYLDYSNEKFQTPYDAGCRMMILYSIAYSVQNLDERIGVIDWLNKENLWNKVSPNEKEFLSNPSPNDDMLMDLSWRIEGALTLAWCLNKIKTLPRLDEENNDQAIEEFLISIPEIGDSLKDFLMNLEYRNLDEIYEENLLNELATSYFRDLMFNGKEDITKINRSISFERHKVLNWLRTSFEGEEEVTGELWDNTDTST